MEFPTLGVHCAVASCSKLDFLPFECDCCHKIFCRDHRVYSDHQCTESYVKDIHVPVCPLCNQPVPVKSGEDPNINVNQHILRDCKEQKEKLYSNKCSYPGCKKKELVAVMCSSCHKNFCLKHRLEVDHQCEPTRQRLGPGPRGKGASSSRPTSSKLPSSSGHSASGRSTGGGRKPQSSLMSQIGADLNRERQERQRQQQQQTAGTRVRNESVLTEDEALSLAIAASLQDSEPAENLSINRNSSKRPEQRLEEDEALARAIAASLNDQSTNRSQTDSKARTSERKTKSSSSSNESNCTIS